MAVKLRLTRRGSKRNPHYRVVAQESKFSRDGRFIEILGHYNAREYPESITLKQDRIQHWLSKGAQPSDAVKKIMSEVGMKKA